MAGVNRQELGDRDLWSCRTKVVDRSECKQLRQKMKKKKNVF